MATSSRPTVRHLAATIMSEERVRIYTFNDKMELIELCLNDNDDAKINGKLSNKWSLGKLTTELLE